MWIVPGDGCDPPVHRRRVLIVGVSVPIGTDWDHATRTPHLQLYSALRVDLIGVGE